ncbi:hypothetical protein SCLARK_00797 [Spiroplasma clarkii]|nr:hypothetical protein SCLARK_00797 [Spiroplasma clarkii]
MGSLFNKNLKTNWTNLNQTSQRLITNSPAQDIYESNLYNGFWIQYYFDFADLNS